MAKYIDNTNLGYLISKIKAAFWPKADATNINLADVAVTGDYDDLSNKPTIPTVPTISTNIEQDKASDDKTASPKAVYDEVHPAVASTQPQGGFLPNVEYNLGTLTGNVTFALASAVSGIGNKWYWCFKAGATAPTITWPTGLLWPQPDAEPPTIEANDEVEVEVKNGHIVALVFKPAS